MPLNKKQEIKKVLAEFETEAVLIIFYIFELMLLYISIE